MKNQPSLKLLLKVVSSDGWTLISRERRMYTFQCGARQMVLTLSELREYILREPAPETLFG